MFRPSRRAFVIATSFALGSAPDAPSAHADRGGDHDDDDEQSGDPLDLIDIADVLGLPALGGIGLPGLDGLPPTGPPPINLPMSQTGPGLDLNVLIRVSLSGGIPVLQYRERVIPMIRWIRRYRARRLLTSALAPYRFQLDLARPTPGWSDGTTIPAKERKNGFLAQLCVGRSQAGTTPAEWIGLCWPALPLKPASSGVTSPTLPSRASTCRLAAVR